MSITERIVRRVRATPAAEPAPRPPVGPAWVVGRGPWHDAQLARDERSNRLTTEFGRGWLLVNGLSVGEAEANARELFELLDSGDPWARCVAEAVRHDLVHVDDAGGQSNEFFGPHATLHPAFAELKRQREAAAAEAVEGERQAEIRAQIARLRDELGPDAA